MKRAVFAAAVLLILPLFSLSVPPLATAQNKAQNETQTGVQGAPGGPPSEARNPAPGEAQAKAQSGEARTEASAGEEKSVTSHTLQVNGTTLDYTAAAGFLPLSDEKGELQARMFYTAYFAESDLKAADRPLTFAFNGGPGASSVWLHLGALGPRRVPLPDQGTRLPETTELVDNPHTWLQFTDLVFIDPVGTGFSRAAQGVDPGRFYSVHGDIESVGDFITLFVSRHARWASPIYLAGESYGTTRAAGLAGYLQFERSLSLAGLVLLSSALDFEAISFDQGNDLPYALSLPSMTAAALYHEQLSPELQADFSGTLAEVEAWSLEEYLPALTRGDALIGNARAGVVSKLAAYTGLPESYIELNSLRVPTYQFIKELLQDKHRTIGLLDGRVLGFPVSPASPVERHDPALYLALWPYAAAFEQYLRDELKFTAESGYVFISMKVNESWDFGSARRGYLEEGSTLAKAMSLNYRLKVLAGSGYYDLTTPYFAQSHMFEHLFLERALRDNITHRYYPSGHQIYTDPQSLEMLAADARKLYEGNRAEPGTGDWRD